MDGTAVVLTNGILHRHNAKTAHGLIRGTDRFEVLAVIDHVHAGRDAGEALDETHRGIPIVATLDEAIERLGAPPDFFVVGIATHGGVLTDELREHLLDALGRGISIVNGLHGFACDDERLVATARASGARIIDVRKTPDRSKLHFWHGAIFDVRAPRIAVLGTDCALGKRTTARFIVEALAARGMHAEMIYTGQTGWMQGAKFGFIFDSVPNDFVSGELEHAIVSCEKELLPDLMVLEGQSSLRNPAGPAGAEFLASGQAKGVVLQHAPFRKHFEGYEDLPDAVIPGLEEECRIVELYGSRVIAIALNGETADADNLASERDRITSETGIPTAAPLIDGMGTVADACIAFVEAERAKKP